MNPGREVPRAAAPKAAGTGGETGPAATDTDTGADADATAAGSGTDAVAAVAATGTEADAGSPASSPAPGWTERLNYVNTVKLRFPELTGNALTGDASGAADEPTALGASAQADHKQGSSHVCAGSIVSIVAGICDDHKQDVLDSTLFAQFAASGQYDRDSQTYQWYTAYVTTLQILGWNTKGFPFQKYVQLPPSFRLYSQVLDLTAKAWPANAQSALSAAIRTLSGYKSSDRRIQVLGQSSVTASAGNFQLGAVVESKDDQVTMQTMAIIFDSQGISGDFLFQSYTAASTTLFAGAQTMVLDDGVYGKMRSMVKSRIGEQIEKFILSIPISG